MNDAEAYLATGFKDVDANQDAAKLIACLEFLRSLPAVAAYKKRALAGLRLEPGGVAADIGCGLGHDLPELAQGVGPGGVVVGVDSSGKLLAEARRTARHPAVWLLRCDAHRLALADASLDAVRADRTLQHVADPDRVIAEMVRALRPGGRLCCAEPDWPSFAIDCHDAATAALVAARWRGGFRNPDIGRKLAGKLRAAGLQGVWVEGYDLLAQGLEAVDAVYDIGATARLLAADDPPAARRLTSWLEGLARRDRAVGASVTVFVAGGRKPPTP